MGTRTRNAGAPAQQRSAARERDPQWYKDAIIYELHVRAFMDSNGDGIGDFRGLTEKLDYLQDLGVTALWLLPFMPSPLRDDGYDTSDYQSVHESYGTLADFKRFLKEAHSRGLRVITELVVNHTSDQHQWFQRARRAKHGSRDRNFYVWSDSPNRYKDARIIFKDFESSNWTYDSMAKAYYWHRFYSHQPDLNYDNPAVRKAILGLVDFWLEMGVDGLRLDAVPYLFEREGTNCENLPETHDFLKELRKHVDARFQDRMLLAEANQWPEDAVAYFGAGDECHMAFHFPVMPRLFMASRLEQRYPIVEILKQTPGGPDSCQWAVFLRNHDELTLEMVTDEERDYMYRMYAGSDPRMRINLGIRRRLAPLLGNNRRKIELMNGLLLSMPGTPVLYYGDEIGMGDNIYLGDRNGVRTPMQWSSDRNAGFSRANPQKLYLPVIIDPEFQYEALNVEAQQNNPSSLLWWMKRVLALRKRHKAFGRGSLEFLEPENHKVLAMLRTHGDETLLVVANLSRFTQYVELDLSHYNGWVPLELFGRTRFPAIGELPYLLTQGPHAFNWFQLQPQEAAVSVRGDGAQLATLSADEDWRVVLRPLRGGSAPLEAVLARYLYGQRWFGSKAQTIQQVRIQDTVPVAEDACIALLRVDYVEIEPETYALPLCFQPAEDGAAEPHHAVARLRLRGPGGTLGGFLCDASANGRFQSAILAAIQRRRRFKGEAGEVTATRSGSLGKGATPETLRPHLLTAEQSNTSVRYGESHILKLFRKLEPGVSQELEISRFLARPPAFPHAAPLAGALEYRGDDGKPMSLAILQGYIPNQGDAWRYTLDALGRYFERVQATESQAAPEVREGSLLDALERPVPPEVHERMGSFWQSAQLLGERTAQLHARLAADADEPDFAPEPFTALYQRSLYQSMSDRARLTMQLLRREARRLPSALAPVVEHLLHHADAILGRFAALKGRRIEAMRIRCHGDYHLGQVLYTGKDFVIIDFEGEPAQALSERRLKRSPLRDVAGMLRSFHYAASKALTETSPDGVALLTSTQPEHQRLQRWADAWSHWASVAFMGPYLRGIEAAAVLPRGRQDLQTLLEAYLLQKALYELTYELNNRPHWVGIPARGIQDLLRSDS